MVVQSERSVAGYVRSFEQFEKSLNGSSKGPLHELRKRAIGQFAERGFPTIAEEDWRFTNLGAMTKIQFEPVLAVNRSELTSRDVNDLFFDNLGGIRLVFVDGHFSQ